LKLDPSRMSGCAVAHGVEEFGQHVLACTVVCSAPPHSRLPKISHPIRGPDLYTLRKSYKFCNFAVPTLLNVKSKTHVPLASGALLLGHKLLLEVHLDRTAPEPQVFERANLFSAPGRTPDASAPISRRTVHSHDVPPQCAIVLHLVLGSKEPHNLLMPASTMLLGQIDLVWRSSSDEPSHLVNSVIPLSVPLRTLTDTSTRFSSGKLQTLQALPCLLHHHQNPRFRRCFLIGPCPQARTSRIRSSFSSATPCLESLSNITHHPFRGA
jgi:hypothetical protein